MASLKEIKLRITSINSTKKITSAMKMVSSAKLHRAAAAIENGLPYERRLKTILTHLIEAVPELDTPYTLPRPVRRIAVVVFSSNSGLCGTFNANVERALYQRLHTYKEQAVETLLYPVGRKIADSLRKQGYATEGNFQQLAAQPSYAEASELAGRLMDLFTSGGADRIELLYHHFRSTASQQLLWDTWLPLSLAGGNTRADHNTKAGDNTNAGGKLTSREASVAEVASAGKASSLVSSASASTSTVTSTVTSASTGVATTISPAPFPTSGNYIIEPSPDVLLAEMLPKVLRLNLYTVLLDTVASEHAARVLAMQTASENANDLLRELTLQYNKSRQQAITNELLDIMGGS